jgi:alkanesulfonate monooxygenase SsuD/methylene tetrahydromethanopterin reductase-like flavin-dependent oxidoreductase (luciferase family)
VRFGVIVLQNAKWSELVERWRLVESLGFDHLWVADHFGFAGTPWLDGWSALAGMAMQTRAIRIGPLVTNMTLRAPQLIAKAAVTIDDMSGGRLNLGLGAAGDFDADVKAMGTEPLNPAERVARFGEFVELLDLLLRNEKTKYEGIYYRSAATVLPRPTQQPRPPIVIGARGPKMIRIAARYADVFNHIGNFGQPDDELVPLFRERNALLDGYCEESGRDPSSITRSMLGQIQGPLVSVATFTEMVERFHPVGIEDFVLYWPYGVDAETQREQVGVLEKVATDVIPSLRKE